MTISSCCPGLSMICGHLDARISKASSRTLKAVTLAADLTSIFRLILHTDVHKPTIIHTNILAYRLIEAATSCSNQSTHMKRQDINQSWRTQDVFLVEQVDSSMSDNEVNGVEALISLSTVLTAHILARRTNQLAHPVTECNEVLRGEQCHVTVPMPTGTTNDD